MTGEAILVASAPGKAVLLGEYAVLEGAPALVMAVGARARVTVRRLTGERSLLDAPDLGVVARGLTLAGGEPAFVPPLEADQADRLRVLVAVLRDVLARGGPIHPAFALASDTSAFVAPSGVKLGLGSSAAVATAAWAAFWRLATGRTPAPDAVLPAVVEAHQAAQGGVGSGADVAASCVGGVLEYSMGDPGGARRPSWKPVTLPRTLYVVGIHTGHAASTTRLVASVRQLAARDPLAHGACMSALAELSRRGCEAARRGDARELLAAARAYGAALAELGRASGADIHSAAHERLRSLVERAGGVYKPSGAGGGDLGLALTDDAAVAANVRAVAAAEGLLSMDLVPEPQGVEVLLSGVGAELVGGEPLGSRLATLGRAVGGGEST